MIGVLALCCEALPIMEGKAVGKSFTGPGAIDVSILMSEIAGLHEVEVSLVIQPAGEYGSGGLQVVALATKKGMPVGEVGRSVSRKRYFPTHDATTFEGLLYKLLVELDWDCSQFWKQLRAPGT